MPVLGRERRDPERTRGRIDDSSDCIRLGTRFLDDQPGGQQKRRPRQFWNHVSHETIYRSLFIQARGALKKELQQYLRSRRHIRRSRKSTLKDDGLGGIPGAVSIRERPTLRCTSVIPRVHGKEAQTKTQTGCSESTCPSTPIYQFTPSQS